MTRKKWTGGTLSLAADLRSLVNLVSEECKKLFPRRGVKGRARTQASRQSPEAGRSHAPLWEGKNNNKRESQRSYPDLVFELKKLKDLERTAMRKNRKEVLGN